MDAFLDIVADTPLEDCLDFWTARAQPDGIPFKRDIDPTAMPPGILPNLFLYQRLPQGLRCRLAGTAIRQTFGTDPTGRFLHELIEPAALPPRLRLFQRCLDEQRAIVYRGRVAEAGREWISLRRLLLPVRSAEGAIDLIFGMVVFENYVWPSRGTILQLGELEQEAAALPLDLGLGRLGALPPVTRAPAPQ
jgi:hypothetical protein